MDTSLPAIIHQRQASAPALINYEQYEAVGHAGQQQQHFGGQQEQRAMATGISRYAAQMPPQQHQPQFNQQQMDSTNSNSNSK